MKAENTLDLDRISAPKLIPPTPWHKEQTDKLFCFKKKKKKMFTSVYQWGDPREEQNGDGD